MARVVGVDLPVNKRVGIGLTYIYGIGRSRATSILQEAQVSPDLRVRDLDEAQLGRIRNVIETQGEVEESERVGARLVKHSRELFGLLIHSSQ